MDTKKKFYQKWSVLQVKIAAKDEDPTEAKITVKNKWNNLFHLTFKKSINLKYQYKMHHKIKLKIIFRNWDSFDKNHSIE
jgi:hypothetical protein